MALIRQRPRVNVHPSCIPVIRCPRSEWRIPRPVNASHRGQQRTEEAQLKALAEGTSVEGREILRKTLYLAEKLVQSQAHTLAQIVDAVESEFSIFKDLQPEFALLLGRFWGSNEASWRQVSIHGLATLVVVRTALAEKLGSRSSGADRR